ncbi:hypothetical protein P6U16_05945 [Rhizobium sp. 32-5/1]|uniref:hypothetical protein n=1 Tax=Rhizobium sp. 32-5/1 TaxID=3019602 RepID=UPI00240DF70B|nr:hypothetical protein [Rhizobium sp. 32-5/1]WEZ84215.1 hypothetical protein P6U16_05945 [Rhizobium sp. 32-5/1]
MNIKTTVTLSERNLRYAEKMVEEGAFPSVSDVIEASIEQMMLNSQSSDDPLAGMADEIRRRMELPRDQWISMKDDDVFENVRARIRARSKE